MTVQSINRHFQQRFGAIDPTRAERNAVAPVRKLILAGLVLTALFAWIPARLGTVSFFGVFPDLWLGLGNTLSLCLFKTLTQLPCPLCGLTRSFVMIASGDWLTAVKYHPFSLPLYFGLWGFVAVSWRNPERAAAVMQVLMKRPAIYATMGLLGLAWIWKLLGNPIYW